MLIITDLAQLHSFDKPCVVAMGTFDGLHLGHLDVIMKAKSMAQQQEALLTVFTFNGHPLELIRPESAPVALLSQAEKRKIFEKYGVDVLLDLPFNREMAELTPEIFFAKLLRLGISGIVVGENFTYGKEGAGTPTTLAQSATASGVALEVRPLVKLKGVAVSSTRIRQLLLAGKVEEAEELLGRPYVLSGVVAHGNERGRLLGFPTANLELADQRIALPPEGVYAVEVKVQDGYYPGMANIGRNPTFADVMSPRLETHLFGYSGNLYGQEIRVALRHRVRAQVRFASVDELQAQLERDKRSCQEFLGLVPPKM